MHLGSGWTVRTVLAAATGTGAAVVALAGCSGLDSTTSGASPEPSRSAGVPVHEAGATEPTPEVELRTRVTRVAGHLTDVRRERVAREARATVEDYLEGAFAGGERPFSGFLYGVRQAARRDAPVLRGGDGVGVTRAAAWFSIAATHGRPVGVSARLFVELPSSSGGRAPTLTGRLLLTRLGGQHEGEWHVFGYDLARGEQ